MDSKKEIRKIYLKKRQELPASVWKENSLKISEQVLKHPLFQETDTIFSYIPFKNEVDTIPILIASWKCGKKVAVPKVLSKTEMKFYEICSLEELHPGAYGILEPDAVKEAEAENALILLPGAVFDHHLRRIGYGGGYYDRFLSTHSRYRTMALAFSMQVVPELPEDCHDIRPEYLVTECGCFPQN